MKHDVRVNSKRHRLLAFTAFASGISCAFSAGQLLAILFTPLIYQKDFAQIYLMGRALRAGVSPYTPIAELAARFDPYLREWLDVSAYPPIIALLALPLSYLPYFWSVVVWLLVEIGCLAAAVLLTAKRFGGKAASRPVLITACFFAGWTPVYNDLTLGQLMIPILLLLTLAWLALRAGKDVQGGLLLGVVMAIKLYAWPLAIFLLLAGRWRSFVTACAVFVTANAFAIWIVGLHVVADYYLRVSGIVLAQYVPDPWNFSAWSIGFRAFGTLGGVSLFALVLCYSLYLALRSKNFETGFMIMLVASTVLQPISWIHYLVTLLPAFCYVANAKHFTYREYFFVLILIAMILPGVYTSAHTYASFATWPPFLFVLGFILLSFRKRFSDSQEIELRQGTQWIFSASHTNPASTTG